MRHFIFISMLVLITLSCEEVIDGPNNTENLDLIVVEGLLTNELKQHTVRITRPYSNQNESPEPVSGATVAIQDSNENFLILSEDPDEPGLYLTDSLRALFGEFYVLFIQHEDREYVAFDSPLGGELMDELLLETQEIEGETFYTIDFKDSGSTPNYITYDIDWTATSNCQPADNCKRRLIYYDLKNIDVQERYAPEKEDFLFPAGATIIRKRFSLSERHVAYLRSLLSETEWRGGFFDVDRSQVTTNLSEGAIGFFGVSTVVSDTIVVNN